MCTNGVLNYLLADHLGSTSLVTDAAGTVISETRYTPYGETRSAAGASPTDYLYTSQRQEAGLGLYFYNARFYDPALGRFTQPDTIVPVASQGTQAWDRYAYANNNPLRYSDPSGHCIFGIDTIVCVAVAGAALVAAVGYGAQVYNNYQNGNSDPWTKNISAEPIIGGALLGAGAVIFAPAAIAAGGDVLAGAGLLTGSTALFGGGMSLYGASNALANAVTNSSTVVKPSVSLSTSSTSNSTTAIVPYDPEFAAQQLIQNGKIPVRNMEAAIPLGTPNKFIPSKTIPEGYKYQFNLGNTPAEFKWHAPDSNALNLYGPTSYSGTRWTAQITVGGRLLGGDKRFYLTQMKNLTHIPIWRR